MKQLVFATNNPHKLQEVRDIVGDRFNVISLSEAGVHEELPETSDTLEGNALQKARRVHELTGLDCFADDTGLLVEALDGAPGVYTARYAGPQCSPADNIRKMLAEMDGKDNRKAEFQTVIALILNGEEHLFKGIAPGEIALSADGSEGFGYDPIFISADTGLRFAQMSEQDKNSVSHRGRATRMLLDFLNTL